MSTAGTPDVTKVYQAFGTKVGHRLRFEDPFSDGPQNPPEPRTFKRTDRPSCLKSLRWPPAAAPLALATVGAVAWYRH